MTRCSRTMISPASSATSGNSSPPYPKTSFSVGLSQGPRSPLLAADRRRARGRRRGPELWGTYDDGRCAQDTAAWRQVGLTLRADNNGTVGIELKEKAFNLAADQVLLIHQEGGQLVISLRSRALHLAGAPALTGRALSDDARHGAARRVAASRAQHGRRPLRRLCAAATGADVGDTPRIVQPG